MNRLRISALAGLIRDCGMRLPGNGSRTTALRTAVRPVTESTCPAVTFLEVSGSKTWFVSTVLPSASVPAVEPNAPEKSPVRHGFSGTVANVGADRLWRIPSYETKKNARFLMIGPPTASPNWLRLRSSVLGAKKLRASKTLLRTNSQATPWKALVPDLTATLTAVGP